MSTGERQSDKQQLVQEASKPTAKEKKNKQEEKTVAEKRRENNENHCRTSRNSSDARGAFSNSVDRELES